MRRLLYSVLALSALVLILVSCDGSGDDTYIDSKAMYVYELMAQDEYGIDYPYSAYATRLYKDVRVEVDSAESLSIWQGSRRLYTFSYRRGDKLLELVDGEWIVVGISVEAIEDEGSTTDTGRIEFTREASYALASSDTTHYRIEDADRRDLYDFLMEDYPLQQYPLPTITFIDIPGVY